MPTAVLFGAMNCALYQAPIRYLRSAAISLCLSGILNTRFSVAGFDQWPCDRRSRMRVFLFTARVLLTLFHDLFLRSYLYHCVWSVITAHNLTPEKRDTRLTLVTL